MKSLRIVLAALVAGAAVAVMAASSANYTVQPAEMDNGGGKALSSGYVLQSSIGGSVIAGTASGASYTNLSDYVAMIQAGGGGAAPDLQLAAGPANPGDSSELRGSPGIPMVQIRLTAGAGGDATVTGLTVRSSGTGFDQIHVTGLALHRDADADGRVDAGSTALAASATAFTADNGSCTLSLSELLAAGTSQTWLLTYDFAATATGTFVASIAAGDVSANDGADPVAVSGLMVSGGTKTVLAGANALNPGTVTFAVGPANLAEGDRFGPGAVGPVFQFTATASSLESVDVTGFTFRASGTADDAMDVAELRLFLDGGADGTEDWATATPLATRQAPFAGDNGSVPFLFPSRNLPASGTLTFLLMARFSGATLGGQTFGVSVPDPGAVSVVGTTSGTAANTAGLPVGSLVTIALAPGAPGTEADGGGCGGHGGGSPLAALLLAILAFGALRSRAARHTA